METTTNLNTKEEIIKYLDFMKEFADTAQKARTAGILDFYSFMFSLSQQIGIAKTRLEKSNIK